MNEIVRAFEYGDTEIRTVLRGGEAWFVARDVCAVLGIANGRDAVSRLDISERGVGETDTPGGRQQLAIISEAGLYRLVMRSNKPDAVRFQMWIAHEVLPSIRETGAYSAPARLPQTYAEALRELATAVERQEQIERELEAAAPKAEAWEVLASAHGDYSVREAAFILNRDPAIDTGQTRLFKLLRDWRLIDSKDRPYAAHANHVRLRAWSSPHPQTGEETARKPQVRITHEGLKYLHRRLGGTEPLAA